MKKLLFYSILSLLISPVFAQVNLPAPSPQQTIKQAFGLGDIEVVYSRPLAKNRVIFGDLVPYKKLWRTGANAATRITFTHPVEMGSAKIEPGVYALYTIPDAAKWEIIINKDFKNSGVSGYKQENDVARFAIPVSIAKDKVESFTIQFDNIQPESCNLILSWDLTKIIIPIKTQIKEQLGAQIEEALKGDKKPYWAAAQYYNEYAKDSKRALEMVSNAIEENPQGFWMYLYKAKIEKTLGFKDAALQTAKRGLEVASEQQSDDYIKMFKEFMGSAKK